MARIVNVILTDDLEEANGNQDVEADEQIRFAIGGRMYDIDLTEENAAQLRSVLKPYVDAGRQAGKIPGRTDLLKRTARRPAAKDTANTHTGARAGANEQRPITEEKHDPWPRCTSRPTALSRPATTARSTNLSPSRTRAPRASRSPPLNLTPSPRPATTTSPSPAAPAWLTRRSGSAAPATAATAPTKSRTGRSWNASTP